MAKVKIQLPEQYDPCDICLKRAFHKNADAKNLIDQERKMPLLVCGAMRDGKPCRMPAGAGTTHTGYGRCKFHGGCSTGPRTKEGKAATAHNARTHGLYSRVLTLEELEVFEILQQEPAADLSHEIAMWKTKLISYLTCAKDKGDAYAGGIEDPAFGDALDTLRHLVETQQRITSKDEGDGMVDAINAELRAASMGLVHLSWDNGARSAE